MAAKAGGGSTASRKRAKDQEMAARMKADGVHRESARCPVCNGIISLRSIYNHISFHPV